MDVACKDGSTPLVWAVAARRADVAEALIHKGAKVDLNLSPSKDRASSCFADKGLIPLQPLHVAARAGAPDLVRFILREGAQVGAGTDRPTDRTHVYTHTHTHTHTPSPPSLITKCNLHIEYCLHLKQLSYIWIYVLILQYCHFYYNHSPCIVM